MLENIRKHRAFALAGILVILLVAVGLSTHRTNAPKEYSLESGPIEEQVTASGHVSSAGTLDIYSSAQGVITEYYVQNGQTIDSKTPLFKITSTATPQEIEAAKAAYQNAIDAYNTADQNKILYQAQLEQARKSVLDAAEGVDSYIDGSGSQDDYSKDAAYSADWSARKLFENAEKKYLDASQTLAAKSQDIKAKKTVLEATQDQTITSSVPGTIANIEPKIGDEVYPLSSTKASPVLTISNFDSYTVDVDVSEKDIYKVQMDQPATVIIESFPDKVLEGTVVKVDTIGKIDNGLVTYTVSIELHGIDIRMRAGMTADVTIQTKSLENVLLIPNDALYEEDGHKFVFIKKTGKFEYIKQKVTLGIKNESFSEVLTGLTGSEILLDPVDVTTLEQS